MGVFEEFSRNVDLLANKVSGFHNRIDELTESSVSAHERITQLEQKLKDEIKSLRDQLQRWSDMRTWNETCVLNELQTLRDRVQKIEDRFAPTCVKVTAGHADRPKVGSTFGPLFDAPSSDPEGVMQRQHEEFRKHDDSIARYLQQNCQLKISPVPGTWAWACEQMLAGKKAENEYGLPTAIIDGKIQEQVDGEWRIAVITRADMHSSKWQVVS